MPKRSKCDGRAIKLECPECGRTARAFREDYDPPEAVLYVIRCPDCAMGRKEEGGTYYDVRGEEVSYFKGASDA